jgi:hypothetical protein
MSEWGPNGASEADNWMLQIATARNGMRQDGSQFPAHQATKCNGLPCFTKSLRPALNQRVLGSSPSASTIFSRIHLTRKAGQHTSR